ncbi:hypothetical protein IQ270_22980 [Microcoleus sp. LEGE 07076]|uniref:hypothetical protein n=1 Tax=Microcoleus sp. LEGE 07076 TaxID=915322 RepID=UPI001881BB13|nr:hypothetical protein [Microcoleus sp. LEGE 07076]MBE9187436.1 hypothetical protein [Microcoleus sp. LEGE 07076]
MSNEEEKISDRQIDKIRTIARWIELLLSIADANLGRSHLWTIALLLITPVQ